MDIFDPFMKSRDLQKTWRWCLVPLVIIAALVLPPLLLSFILVFVLILGIKPLHYCACAFPGSALLGWRIGAHPRGPPVL
jgi:hypothetical protein